MPAPPQNQPRGPGRPAGGQKGEARGALLRAARAAMTEKGLTRVTAREVAERAGLNPGLVRYYFGNRDGLLRAVVADIAEEGQARAREWSQREGDARERLRGLLASMIRSFAEDPYAARLLTEQVLFAEGEVVDHFVDAFGRSHVELLRTILDDGVASGVFRDIDPELVIPAITGSVMFFFLASPVFLRLFDHDALTPERVEGFADATATLVLDGIGRRTEDAT